MNVFTASFGPRGGLDQNLTEHGVVIQFSMSPYPLIKQDTTTAWGDQLRQPVDELPWMPHVK
jgi:hypothetical protein